MPKLGWRKNQDTNLEKQADAAEKSTAIVKEEVTTKIFTTEVKESKDKPDDPKPIQGISSDTKRKLPKIIISTYDKQGNLVTKEYTCHSIDLEERTNTTLSGGQPTSRKDFVHISLEADVVGIL